MCLHSDPNTVGREIASNYYTVQASKNISIKMLKDVGMTVPKSRETSAVYICSNTGNEGTIFICRMKAVHNMHQDRG